MCGLASNKWIISEMKKLYCNKCCVQSKSMMIRCGSGWGVPDRDVQQLGGGLGMKSLCKQLPLPSFTSSAMEENRGFTYTPWMIEMKNNKCMAGELHKIWALPWKTTKIFIFKAIFLYGNVCFVVYLDTCCLFLTGSVLESLTASFSFKN